MTEADRTAEIRPRLVKNAMVGALGVLVSVPLTLVVTPYMLAVLGPERFAVWAVGGAVIAFAQLSDLGMSTALVKHFAAAWVAQDRQTASELASVGFFVFAGVGGGVFVALMLSLDPLVTVLRVPPAFGDDLKLVVRGTAAAFYVSLTFSVLDSLLQGFQRVDLSTAIAVAMRIARVAAVLVVLSCGLGLEGLVAVSIGAAVLTAVANIVAVRRLAPWLRVSHRMVSRRVLVPVVRFSAPVLGGRLLALAEGQVNKLVLTRWTSLETVAEYEVGYRASSMAAQVLQSGSAPALPAVSGIAEREGLEETRRVFAKILRIVWIVAPPYFLTIVALASPLLDVWVGPGHDAAVHCLRVLVVTSGLGVLGLPAYLTLQALGLPRKTLVNHLIGGCLNLLVGLTLVGPMGLQGVLVGMVVSYLGTTVHLYVVAARAMGVSSRHHLQEIPLGWVLSVTTWAVLVHTAIRYTEMHGLAELFLAGIASALFFYFGSLRQLSERDRGLISSLANVVPGAHFGPSVRRFVRAALRVNGR